MKKALIVVLMLFILSPCLTAMGRKPPPPDRSMEGRLAVLFNVEKAVF